MLGTDFLFIYLFIYLSVCLSIYLSGKQQHIYLTSKQTFKNAL